jgi:hypothetical protein
MKEKGKDILIRAIRELPERRLEDSNLWNRIEIRLNQVTELKNINILTELPAFKAPDTIWNKVENELDSLPLRKAIEELPSFSAPDDIWPGIEEKAKQIKLTGLRKNISILFKVAAVFLAIIGISLLFRAYLYNLQIKGKISYSQEIIENSSLKDITQNPDALADEHMKVLCINNPVVCSTPQFDELRRQIDEISLELENMKSILEKGNDPQIQRYYYQLENEKAQVEQKIIKMINQS